MSGKLTEQEKFEQIIEDTEERFWKLYGDPDIEQLPSKPISYRKWEVLINNYETNDLLYGWSLGLAIQKSVIYYANEDRMETSLLPFRLIEISKGRHLIADLN